MTFINVVELEKSFLTLFLILARSHSFGDLWGGGGYPPPPVGAKLVQTPVGARVNLILSWKPGYYLIVISFTGMPFFTLLTVQNVSWQEAGLIGELPQNKSWGGE